MYNQPELYFLGRKVVYSKECSVLGGEYNVTVDRDSWNKWEGGASIHKAFPNLTDDQYQFLLTGYTPAEHEKLFGEDDEDTDEIFALDF